MAQWGGKRRGSGRPKGSGPHGEATVPMRIPHSLENAVCRFVERRGFQLPLYGARVAAGFPSPADDFLEGSLDLNEHLIHHPAATFFVRVTGDSMILAGIFPGDLLIVDRSLEPAHKRIVIAILQGELTVKRLLKTQTKIILQPENPAYSPIELAPDQELQIWGVVTTVIHSV